MTFYRAIGIAVLVGMFKLMNMFFGLLNHKKCNLLQLLSLAKREGIAHSNAYKTINLQTP